MAVVTAYVDQVQKAYIAYYGRPADTGGLDYWTNQLSAAGGSWTSIINAFGNSAEATGLLANLTTAQKVNNLYQQMFGRDADLGGLQFYVAGITAGTYTLASIAVNIMNGTQAGSDADALANKLTSAKLFTDGINTAAEYLAYDGAAAATSARAWMAAITTTSASQASADGLLGTLVTNADNNPGQSFTLTTNADNITGTSGNDTFVGTLPFSTNAIDTAATLTPGDQMHGGGGIDTFTISTSGSAAAAGYTASPVADGVERVLVSNVSTDAAYNNVVDLSLVDSALTTVGTSASTTAAVLTEFTNAGKLVDVEMAGRGNLKVGFAAGVTGGVADSLNLTVNGVGTSATTTSTFTATGIETLNVTSATSANYLTDATGATTVNVSGSKALTMTVNGSATTVNAAASTGGVVIDGATNSLAIGAAGVTVTGGTGNDTFVTDQAIAATSDLVNITGFENLALAGSTASLDAAVSGVSTFVLAAGSTESLTFATGYTGATTVKMTGGTGDTDAVINTANVALTVVGNIADVTTGETVTGGTGTDVLQLTADGVGATLTNVTGVETITVLAKSTVPTTTASITTVDATVASGKTLTVDATALTSSTATLTFDGALESNGNFVVTGGAAADTITGGAGNDVLAGGAGNDSITAGAGNDSINGGAGNDRIVMAGNLTSADTVDGGDGTDTVSVSSVAANAFAHVTNVENVEIAGGTVSLNAAIGASTTFVLAAGSTESLTFATGYTGATTVKMTGGTGDTDAVINTANVALTVVGNIADVTTGETVTGGTGTDVLQLTADGVGATLTNVTGVETITVLAKSTVPTTTASITTVDATVASGKTLTVDATALTSSTATLTFDGALESNGNFVVTGGAAADTITGGAGNDVLAGGAGNDSITAGAGNDSIDAGAGNDAIMMSTNLTFDDTIAGGDGTDTLYIANTGGTFGNAGELSHVTGVERLAFTGASEAVNAGTSFIGFTYFDLTNAGNTALTLAAGFTGATTVVLTGDNGANADSIINTANVTLGVTANVDDLDATTTITGGTGTDIITLKANGGTATTTAISKIDSIVVTAGTVVTDDATITMGANDTQITAGKTLVVDATALTDSGATLTFTGNAAETDGNLSVTGGAGADTIVGAGGADTLIGGAGADSLTGGAGLDVLTGGTGADTFVITAPTTKFYMDTITDATLLDNDVIAMTDAGGAGAFTATAITLVSGATLSDYINTAAADTGAATATSAVVSWFQYDSNTYIVSDLSDAATFVDGTDIVVKLSGLIDLSGASLSNAASFDKLTLA